MPTVAEKRMSDGLPIGAPVDTREAGRPAAVVREGRFARVEKTDPARDGDALWDAVRHDDALFTYMAYGPFPDRAAFDAWLAARAASPDAVSYSVIDRTTGRATGTVTLMEARPAMRVIEIGNIVYGTPLQRTAVATEAQYLLAAYVFETLRYRRYEWKCNALNAPSRRAALRYGFSFEGLFRQHMIVKGRNRDTAWFSMLDHEWPARKAAFERWLDPANFDADGRQRVSLTTLNGRGFEGEGV